MQCTNTFALLKGVFVGAIMYDNSRQNRDDPEEELRLIQEHVEKERVNWEKRNADRITFHKTRDNQRSLFANVAIELLEAVNKKHENASISIKRCIAENAETYGWEPVVLFNAPFERDIDDNQGIYDNQNIQNIHGTHVHPRERDDSPRPSCFDPNTGRSCYECKVGVDNLHGRSWRYYAQDMENMFDKLCNKGKKCNEPSCAYQHPEGREKNMCRYMVKYAKKGGVFNRDEILARGKACPHETCPLNHFCHRCHKYPRCGCRYLHVVDHRGHDGKRIAVGCQNYIQFRCTQECDDRYETIVKSIAACARGEKTQFCRPCAQQFIDINHANKSLCGKKGGSLWKPRMEFIWAIIEDIICDGCTKILNDLKCRVSDDLCPSIDTHFTKHLNTLVTSIESFSAKETQIMHLMPEASDSDDDDGYDQPIVQQAIPHICMDNFPYKCARCPDNEMFDMYHVIIPMNAVDVWDPKYAANIYQRIKDIGGANVHILNAACIMYDMFRANTQEPLATQLFISATAAWDERLIIDVCQRKFITYTRFIPPPCIVHPMFINNSTECKYVD